MQKKNKYTMSQIGVIVMLMAVFMIYCSWDQYDVQQNGQLVKMHIDAVVPPAYKKKPELLLSYQGDIYLRVIGEVERYQYKEGNLVEVYYKQGHDTIMFPSEHPLVVVLLSVWLLIMGGMMVVYNLIDAGKKQQI